MSLASSRFLLTLMSTSVPSMNKSPSAPPTSNAEGWVQHAHFPRAKVVGPHEREHVAHVFHHRAVDRQQFQSPDPFHQVKLGEVDGRADEFFVRLLLALLFQVDAMELPRLLDDVPRALKRGRRDTAVLQDRKAFFRDPSARPRGRVELLEVEAQQVVEAGARPTIGCCERRRLDLRLHLKPRFRNVEPQVLLHVFAFDKGGEAHG